MGLGGHMVSRGGAEGGVEYLDGLNGRVKGKGDVIVELRRPLVRDQGDESMVLSS
jgi:hypothetical protein